MWTFESEIERISQERAQQALLSAQREHEQQLERAIEQDARASAKRLAQSGISYAEIAEVLSIAAEKVAEYVETR